ncbi:B Box And Spry Domain-Containing Protein [Manis pentadactyla]|nr:B Box And Spry Domain-Containing Protein [Manis pentadactyla]
MACSKRVSMDTPRRDQDGEYSTVLVSDLTGQSQRIHQEGVGLISSYARGLEKLDEMRRGASPLHTSVTIVRDCGDCIHLQF